MNSFFVNRRPKVRVLHIGVGGYGCNLLGQYANTYSPEQQPDTRICVLNTDQVVLGERFFENQSPNMTQWHDSRLLEIMLMPGETADEPMWGAGANPEIGAAAARRILPEVEKYAAENADVVFLHFGTSKGTGGGGGPEVATRLSANKRLTVIAMVVMPEEGEGNLLVRQGNESLRKTLNHVPTVVYQNGLIRKYAELYDLPVDDAWSEQNRVCILEPLTMFTEMFQRAGSSQNSDLSDARRIARKGTRVAIGIAKFARGENPSAQEAVTRLIEGQFQDVSVITKASELVTHFHAAPSRRIVNEIHDELRKRLRPDGNTLIIPGYYKPSSEMDEGWWVAYFTAAPKELFVEEPDVTIVEPGPGPIPEQQAPDAPARPKLVVGRQPITGREVDGAFRTVFLDPAVGNEWKELVGDPYPKVEQVQRLVELRDQIHSVTGILFDLPPKYKIKAAQLVDLGGKERMER